MWNAATVESNKIENMAKRRVKREENA